MRETSVSVIPSIPENVRALHDLLTSASVSLNTSATPTMSDRDMDAIFDAFDELFRAGQFGAVDTLLQNLKVSALSTGSIISILTTTGWARPELTARKQFVQVCVSELGRRGQIQPGLLDGLIDD